MPILVREIMSGDYAARGADCPVDDAMQTLLEQQLAEIYVVSDGEVLLGIVPDFELLKAQLLDDFPTAPLSALMTTHVPIVEAHVSIDDVIASFRESRYRQAAVIEAGRLIGVLTRMAVLQSIAGSEPTTETPPTTVEPLTGPAFLRMRSRRRGPRFSTFG